MNVAIYDARGERVAMLFDGVRNAGEYSVDWDGQAVGESLAALGLYFARIEQNGVVRSKKLVMLK